jgi:hypothetical protein
MKSLIKAVAIAAVLAVPAISFAQSQGNGPVTRAQVRNELVQLEAAGYRPSLNDINYPDDLQKAQARVNAQNGAAVVQTSGYGPDTSGSSQSGSRTDGAVSSYSPPVYNAH